MKTERGMTITSCELHTWNSKFTGIDLHVTYRPILFPKNKPFLSLNIHIDGVHVQFKLKDLANVNILNIHLRTSINVKFQEISNGHAPAG